MSCMQLIYYNLYIIVRYLYTFLRTDRKAKDEAKVYTKWIFLLVPEFQKQLKSKLYVSIPAKS